MPKNFPLNPKMVIQQKILKRRNIKSPISYINLYFYLTINIVIEIFHLSVFLRLLVEHLILIIVYNNKLLK